jgi:hypothetical protein
VRPPIVFPEDDTLMPELVLGRAAVPAAFVPM